MSSCIGVVLPEVSGKNIEVPPIDGRPGELKSSPKSSEKQRLSVNQRSDDDVCILHDVLRVKPNRKPTPSS